MKIFIVGELGEGKDTIASEICALLESLGLNVEKRYLPKRRSDDDHDEALSALRTKGLHVTVELITQSTVRPSKVSALSEEK